MYSGIRSIHARRAFREARLTSAAICLQSLFRGVYVINLAITSILTLYV